MSRTFCASLSLSFASCKRRRTSLAHLLRPSLELNASGVDQNANAARCASEAASDSRAAVLAAASRIRCASARDVALAALLHIGRS